MRTATAWMVAALVAVATLACSRTAPRMPALEPAAHAHVVYLVSHGWHVGLAVRRADVPPASWPESTALGHVRYLEVGWGDGEYYPLARGHPGVALQAAFGSTSSVLHVAGIDAPLTEFFSGSAILEVPLSPAGFAALIRFIESAYERDGAGVAIVTGSGLYGVSRFYRARGRYRLFDNSNHWTARALAAAGCPIDPAETLTAGRLLDRARAFGRVLRPPATDHAHGTCRG